MNNNSLSKWEKPILLIYISLYLIISISMVLKQPLGNPPDETNRYRIPLYIYEHHALPNGYDEEIRIPGYGFSYGFQPILPYMMQGGAMIVASVFTNSSTALVYVARFVNCFLGLLMAVFVWKLSKKWFKNATARYLFSFLVMFLPQSIFLHTYVNTESCAMLSSAMILYGITCCLEDDFSYKSSVLLSAGVILCALSYYNAYGYILGAMILFVAWAFRGSRKNNVSFDKAGFLKKGGFICLLVLLGIAWWFIRSAIIYDGDFLGLKARALCGEMYEDRALLSLLVPAFKEQGLSVFDMLFNSDFFIVTITSFICAFGPMTVITSIWVYRFFKAVFFGGILLFAFMPAKVVKAYYEGYTIDRRPVISLFYRLNLIMCAAIPVILSITYSYKTDYQPQGRYIMPALIPLCYFTVAGIKKGVALLTLLLSKAFKKEDDTVFCNRLVTIICSVLTVGIAVCLIISIYVYAFPQWETFEDLLF